VAQKKKPIRRNYYRNSASRRRARRIGRFRTAVKAVAGVLILAAASSVLIFGYDYLTQCAYFTARQIRVTGNHRVEAERILSRARLATGVNILSVNLYLVRQRLLADPWIAQAQVRRELPDSIEIRVTEQRPLAILDLGRKFLLNDRGEVFMELNETTPVPLPLVSGLEFSDLHLEGGTGSPAFGAVMEVLRLGLRPDTALPFAAIDRIEVDRQLGLTVHAFGGTKVIKIGFHDYPDKYDRLRTVMVFLNRDGRLPDFSVIDLNYRNRIVVTPAQANASEKEHEEV
jgi:cell division protein FtsQ